MATITLPPKPDALPADTFNDRMLNWWRECDVLLRLNCQEQKAEFFAAVSSTHANLAPTLDKVALAWNAFDVRLGELAGALNAQAAGTDVALILKFALDFAKVALDKPGPDAAP